MLLKTNVGENTTFYTVICSIIFIIYLVTLELEFKIFTKSLDFIGMIFFINTEIEQEITRTE